MSYSTEPTPTVVAFVRLQMRMDGFDPDEPDMAYAAGWMSNLIDDITEVDDGHLARRVAASRYLTHQLRAFYRPEEHDE
jgi:hypothetical protein